MTKRILLIDSDETFAQSLSNAMNARGFAATMATNSEQGMSLAKQESPDLIVVCVEAQPTNGYMLCTRLKKDEQLKLIPVILTSANATPDSFEKHKKLKTRAEEYLIKPFAPQVMLDKASALLGVQLPPEAPAEDIVTMEDESLGLGDLVSGEDEPIHLSEHEVAEAHSGEEPMVVDEVEEVVSMSEEPQPDTGDDDLKMFDRAFDSLGGPGSSTGSTDERFAGLHAVPAPEEHLELQEAAEPHVEPQPTELTAPDDEAVLHGLLNEGETHAIDTGAVAALEQRVAELEQQLAGKDAELENAKKSAASSGETLKLKEAKNKADKEVLRLKEELHAKEREVVELQEQHTSLEGQAQQLKDDSVKRDGAAKALQQRADALAAAAKKFERELTQAREELKQVAALKARVAELEKLQGASDELQKKHAETAAELEKHRTRAGQLESELAGAHEVHLEELETARGETEQARRDHAAALKEAEKHAEELQQARGELETTRHELEGVRAEHDTVRTELEGVRAEHDTVRTELEGVRAEHETTRSSLGALAGEKDQLAQERDDLRKQLEDAKAQAALNEDRAVKAFQKIKGDEKLREKTRKALQIALQLLDENAVEDDGHPEKQSA